MKGVLGLVSGAGLLALVGCNSASVDEAWKAPDAKTLEFKKVMVVAPIKDGALRRTFEDALASKITGTQVIPSYTVIPSPANLKNFDNLTRGIIDSSSDGIVIARPVASRDELNYTPGPYAYPAYYGGLRGYWGGAGIAASMAYDADFYTDHIVIFEVNIYRASDYKLLFSTTVEDTNPGSVTGFVDDIAKVIKDELKKEGLIK